MRYAERQQRLAAAWKQSTPELPDEARAPAGYVFKDDRVDTVERSYCLPARNADFNLLAAVRDDALALFAALGIPWHAGVDGGPSNHLLSSQVQCANALTAMVTDPARVLRAFGNVLGIEEVLPIEPGRYLTFEYIGARDFFDEVPGSARVRGAHCTSVDAAIRYRGQDGRIELALIEWKYVEKYPPRKPQPNRDATRLRRYGAAVADAAGPLHGDLVPFEALLQEPFYQLTRQQLLAHALEQIGAEGAARVRVVHVAPKANGEYWGTVHDPELRRLGDDVGAVWARLLRHPDRFISLDSSIMWNSEITSREYVLRYSDQVAYRQEDLLRILALPRGSRRATKERAHAPTSPRRSPPVLTSTGRSSSSGTT